MRMILPRALLIAGAVIIAFGILFVAQSKSLAGPESSFMYRNPEWTINGGIIAIIGVAVIVAGLIAMRMKS